MSYTLCSDECEEGGIATFDMDVQLFNGRPYIPLKNVDTILETIGNELKVDLFLMPTRRIEELIAAMMTTKEEENEGRKVLGL